MDRSTTAAAAQRPPRPAKAGRRRTGRTSRANGQATRRRILKQATKMFAARGFAATSLRQVAAAADVDLATLKYHFGTKPQLYAEVYRAGHQTFAELLIPLMADLTQVQSRADLRAQIQRCASWVYDYLADNDDFIRLVLFRLLEDESPIEALEDELQGAAMELIDTSLEHLVQRGIIRRIDFRGLVTLLTSGIPAWYVTAQAKPKWLGEPDPLSPAGRPRAEAFFTDLLERALSPSL